MKSPLGIPREWLGYALTGWPQNAAMMRLALMNQDLAGIELAFSDFTDAKLEIESEMFSMNDSPKRQEKPGRSDAHARLFHHAKVFVVCMRRFARLLEDAFDRRSEYPPAIGKEIELVWRKRCHVFRPFTEARNAIEHIDSELRTSLRLLNLYNNVLEVTDCVRVEISKESLEVARRSLWEIALPLNSAFGDVALLKFRQDFLGLLDARINAG